MPQDIDEQTFEQSVAELAVNTLKTKVPALMDYALAFQLVDHSDDDTRAVGFYGFKIGEGLIYVPIFFLSGEIKGTELCYVVDEDRFVPLGEDWVNQLIRRKTFTIGDTAGKDRAQQGITGPDLRRLRVPPMEAKIGSDLSYNGWAPWASHGVQMFATALRATEKLAMPSLPEVVAKNGITIPFIKNLQSSPKLAEAVFQFYKPEDFLAAFDKLAASSPVDSTIATVERPVRIFDGDDAMRNPAELGFLSESEKKQVMRGNTVIQDGRRSSDKKKVYDIEITKRISNPSDGGCYDVITETGEIAKLWVLEPKLIGTGGTRDIRVVVNDKGEYMLAPKTTIWVTRQYLRSEISEDLDKLGTSLSSKDTWNGDWDGFVITDAAGRYAIGPFSVDTTLENADGTTTLFVQQKTPKLQSTTDIVNAGANRSRRGMPFDGVAWTSDGVVNLTDGGDNNNNPFKGYMSTYDNLRRIVITDKPLKSPVFANGVVLVPRDQGFRAIKLTKEMQGSSAPGSTADMYLKINKFAESLEVSYDGQLYRVKHGDAMKPASTIKKAYEILCLEVGVGAEDAKDMVKVARETPKKTFAYYVEKLASPPFDHPDFTAHHEPMFDAPVQQGGLSIQNLLPEHASFDPGSSQIYRHFKDENNYSSVYSKDVDTLNKATQTGQKELFDASAIGALVNVGDVNEEIEEYLPVLMKALDKLGRTLFMFYWHNEDVQERYGKTESKDLQENIQSVFENLGEAVLDLKKSGANTRDLFGSGIIGGGSTAASSN